MTTEPHPFEALIERELRDAGRVAREDDERMAAAARGEPFWGVGKPGNAEMIGLADFTPALATQYDTGWRRCVVCGKPWHFTVLERRAHGWCDCGGGLQWAPAWHVSPTAHHDPGDEDRSER